MKRKLLRNVSLVALSAVLCAGSAAAFAGCNKGGSKDYTISINIFCDATDAATNEKICQDWADRYQEQLWAAGTIPEGQEITIKFDHNPTKEKYFEDLNNNFSRGNSAVADVIYMAPKYTKTFVEKNRVMNIADLIQSEEEIENVGGIWNNALSFFGYSKDAAYHMGDPVSYREVNGKAGFYTDTGDIPVGIYALPKDYSNFAMGYNARFFSDELKFEYQTKTGGTTRNVKGALNNAANQTYTGDGMDGMVATYAVDVPERTITVGNHTKTLPAAKKGDPAPLINIGIPTKYLPYNFYAYSNFQAALQAGDPVALLSYQQTGGEGYVVTMPGFPGETFQIPEGTEKDPDALYDKDIGHVVYTYAEYGALTWAVTYFCNTFNWTATEKDGYTDSDLTSGTGGMTLLSGKPENVYGSDQYEGAPGPTLYLLPWLAGNDANFITQDSKNAIQPEEQISSTISNLSKDSKGGKATETVKKLRLNGEYEDVPVQYGVNSESFIETYGAFLAYGSDWNGNSGNARSENAVKEDNGWSLFRDGACIFYGAGTWDSKTKNESPTSLCEFRNMPMPVGEKYALYSSVRNGYYEMETYQWDAENNTRKATATLPSKPYTQAEIAANLTDRQDKWAARTDSVGYAANKSLESLKGTDGEWKIAGAASLIMELTADKDAQRDLTYGGAQLPNFKQQCVDFLNYQEAGYENATFKDMITPEGFSTTKYYNADGTVNPDGKAEADKIWSYYIGVVEALQNEYTRGNKDQTVGEFLKGKTDYNGTGSIRYDKQFENTKISEFTGERAQRAFIMKIFYMTTYTKADRDLVLRIQYGVNSVRDAAMYTYEDTWINDLTMRSGSIALAYCNALPRVDKNKMPLEDLFSIVEFNPGATNPLTLKTPAVFCMRIAKTMQTHLDEAIAKEQRALNK